MSLSTRYRLLCMMFALVALAVIAGAPDVVPIGL